jgi:integrase
VSASSPARCLRAQVRPGTWAEHKSKVEVHLIPAIGGVPLQRLTPGHLNALYADLLEQGRSARTVLHVHATIRRALADAVRWGLVPRNVALLAAPPRPGRPELQVWTAAELRAFLAAVEGDRLYALWLLAASTGMRPGELLGLQWPDVDLGRPGSRSAGPWSRSATRSSSLSPRRRRAAGRSRSTRPPSQGSRHGASSRRPSGWPGGRPGRARAWCSPEGTAGRSTPGK